MTATSLSYPNKTLHCVLFTTTDDYIMDIREESGTIFRYRLKEEREEEFVGEGIHVFYGVLPRLVLNKELFLLGKRLPPSV